MPAGLTENDAMKQKISGSLLCLLLVLMLVSLFVAATSAFWTACTTIILICSLLFCYHFILTSILQHKLPPPDKVCLQRFLQFTENSEQIFWLEDPYNQKILYVSPAYENVWGQPRSALFLNSLAWLQQVHPDDQIRVKQERFADISRRRRLTYRILRPDGQIRWISEQLFPIDADDDNVTQHLASVASDVTEQYQLQMQLAQSQRMESLGKLTGGIAHDFNNLLTIIMGNAELIVDQLERQHPLHRVAVMLVKAAERGVSLNQQLLAFASKQQLQPVKVKLAELLDETVELLQRTLPLPISLQVFNKYKDCVVCVDPGQLQNAILNLCLNAKDALGQQGQISIRVEKELQRYPAENMVVIAVTDNGCGIAANDLDRIFEPFYSTKALEQGSGLGLSMVYGFVRQSAGYIEAISELNKGTTIKLWLPVYQAGTVAINTT